MKRDKLIFKLLDEEQQRQEEGIELIASENFVSRQVMEAAGSVATNKYAELTAMPASKSQISHLSSRYPEIIVPQPHLYVYQFLLQHFQHG